MKVTDRLLQRWRIRKTTPYLSGSPRVLDIGCAEGELFRLHPHLKNGVGIDPDLNANVSVGENHLIRGLFPVDLPDDQPFDVITMLAVLEHIPLDVQNCLATDCARSLRPGGHLIITVPSPFVDYILNALRFARLIDGMSLEQHYGFDVRTTPSLFEQAGLRLTEAKTFQLGLNNFFAFHKPELKS